jgi:hypothetical protein
LIFFLQNYWFAHGKMQNLSLYKMVYFSKNIVCCIERLSQEKEDGQNGALRLIVTIRVVFSHAWLHLCSF